MDFEMKRNITLAALLGALVLTGLGCGTDPASNAKPNGMTNGGDCEPGVRTCQDTLTLATCARSQDGTPRLVTTTCLDTEECRDGDCVELPRDCSDTCTPPETRCTQTGEVETCSDHNGDSCNEFGGARACDAGEVCDAADGLCKMSMCTDECAEGETSCEDDLITTCVTGVEGCLGFGPAKECPEGQACADGTCEDVAGCEDECTEGETVCSGDGNLRECRTDVDADSCTEFTAGTACPGTDVCRQGECVAENACQDQCLAGEQVCVNNDIAVCETNDEGCLEFTAPMACPGANESCQNMGGGNVMCAPVVVSGKVVINEIFYDALGDDTRGVDGSPTFIELYGPPGVTIAGYTIELVNGSGGATYGSFDLPADAQLDGNGFAVVTTDQPDSFMNILPFFTNVYFVMTGGGSNQDVLQNGADNVRLLDDAGTEVDAVGYGDFAGLTFVGEGNPASDVVSGHSLGRVEDGLDTDDNAADFVSFFPTPSLPNSDLLINEIYFDQPSTDDGTETFVELMAPILGWEDLPLDGYVLHAINGFNGDDYLFSGLLPGIEMSGTMLNDVQEGYVVVCNIDTSDLVASGVCTVPYEGVDFQNGPDSFVLRYQGRIVDAVAYGSFSAGDSFAGEGTAAPFSTSDAGKSLSRWPIYDVSRDLDTDDNSVDFSAVDPTPGTDNTLP